MFVLVILMNKEWEYQPAFTLINAIVALFYVGIYPKGNRLLSLNVTVALSETASIFSVRLLQYVFIGSHFSCSDYINLKVQHGGSGDI